jgi:hypothetical protein
VFGVGVWGRSPTPQNPNPQSPIPNPHFIKKLFILIILIKFNLKFNAYYIKNLNKINGN